jgi:hypothetical protein
MHVLRATVYAAKVANVAWKSLRSDLPAIPVQASMSTSDETKRQQPRSGRSIRTPLGSLTNGNDWQWVETVITEIWMAYRLDGAAWIEACTQLGCEPGDAPPVSKSYSRAGDLPAG